MIAGVWGQSNKVVFQVRYLLEIIFDVYVILPIIKRYLDFEKEQRYEMQLEEEAEIIAERIVEAKPYSRVKQFILNETDNNSEGGFSFAGH